MSYKYFVAFVRDNKFESGIFTSEKPIANQEEFYELQAIASGNDRRFVTIINIQQLPIGSA